jgi:tetrapyrrole methylase family protein/MazG family protein
LGKHEGLEGIVEEVVASWGDDFDRLVSLVRTLRSAGGCPWDRVQTAETIKVYLIEEAHEVLDALESYNAQDVCGELGDLLFHILFLARIFEETGDFNIGDVVQEITEKMIRRHPHVFGNARASTSEDVRRVWQEVKMAEAKDHDTSRSSCLDAVPERLPTLMRAYRLGERASRFGRKGQDAQGAVMRVEEDLARLKAALGKDDLQPLAEEFGNLLFKVVNLGRLIGIHPETALTRTISRFVKRVKDVEETLRQQGRTLESIFPEEMAAVWEGPN